MAHHLDIRSYFNIWTTPIQENLSRHNWSGERNEERFCSKSRRRNEEEYRFPQGIVYGKIQSARTDVPQAKEDIGEETHDDVDQFFRFEEGEGVVVIDGVRNVVKDGSGVIVPSGAKHNVVNTSKTKNLKLYHDLLSARAPGQGCPKDKAGGTCPGRALRRETDRKIIILQPSLLRVRRGLNGEQGLWDQPDSECRLPAIPGRKRRDGSGLFQLFHPSANPCR